MMKMLRQVHHGIQEADEDGVNDRDKCGKRFQLRLATMVVSEPFEMLLSLERAGGGSGDDSRLTAGVDDGTFASNGCKRHLSPSFLDYVAVYRDFVG